jgi:TadE-like protein
MRTQLRDMLRPRGRMASRAQRGQALVEFALVVVPFLVLLMGVIDLGRGIYMMNGTAEAARDITRATIVHMRDGSGNLGMSPETTEAVNTQRTMIPGLTIAPATDITCVDEYDVVVPDANCLPGNFIKVRVTAPFTPVTPIVSAFGSHTFESVSRMQVPTANP